MTAEKNNMIDQRDSSLESLVKRQFKRESYKMASMARLGVASDEPGMNKDSINVESLEYQNAKYENWGK